MALLAHVAALSFPWGTTAPVAEQSPRVAAAQEEVLVEFTPNTETVPAPTPTPEDAELYALQEFRTAAAARAEGVEHTLTTALRQRAAAEAERRQQLATLEAEQTAMAGRVESLTIDTADLSAQLLAEQERASTLAQQLEEARRVREAELSTVKGTYDRLVASLQSEISQKEIALHQAKERLTVTILDRVLFPSGQVALSPEGQQVMQKVGAVLAQIGGRRILIEGHTDNVPIGPVLSARFPTNWELSAARATEVVRYLIAQVRMPAERLSAVGRADTTPVAGNDSEDGRRLNRRIEIIVLPPDPQPAAGVS